MRDPSGENAGDWLVAGPPKRVLTLLPSGSITSSSGLPPGRVDWNAIRSLVGAVCDAVCGPVPLLHPAASSASRTPAIPRVVFIGPPPVSIAETPKNGHPPVNCASLGPGRHRVATAASPAA